MTERKDIKPFDWKMLERRGNHMVVITPEIADQLLSINTRNRTPRRQKIEQFKREMLNGRWDPDASDIKISRQPHFVVDGQNRLMAAVEAQVPFPTLLRTGQDPETQNKVDTGTARTTADALKMAGVSYGPALAAACVLRMRFEERIADFGSKRGMDAKATVAPTHDEVLEFLGRHPQMEKMATRAHGIVDRVIPSIQRSVLMAALGWFAEVNEADAVAFQEALLEGAWGGPGDPLMALIAYAARNAGPRKSGAPGSRGRVAQEENLMALIKVWNAWREGEPIKLLSIRRSELIEVPR